MLHNFVTNEFKNSSVAKNQRDVRTTWSEGKAMTYTCIVLVSALFAGIAHQL